MTIHLFPYPHNSVMNAGNPKQYFTWVTKLILRILVWILTALYNF